MDPFLIPRFILLSFQNMIRLIGPKWFWRLFGLSSALATVLIIRDSI